MTKTKEQAPTVHTATLVDVFATIAKEHEWCGDAERYFSAALDVHFVPYPEDYCCSEHSDFERFTLAEGSPETVDARKVADAVKYQVGRGYLDRREADRLLALVPEEFRYPPKTVVKVSFTVEVDDLSYLTGRSTRGTQRYLGERLYGGAVQNFEYSA